MSILSNYETATNQLLINPIPSTPLYATADLDLYINEARTQLAGEAECIRAQSTNSTGLVNGQQDYPFSTFSTFTAGNATLSGISGVLAIRQIYVPNAGGFPQLLTSRSYEWFFESYLASGAAVATGIPTRWTQVGRGASGTFSLNPIPNATMSITADVVCLPTALTSMSAVEPIPYPFTDAIPFYAAYKAKLSSQQTEIAMAYYRQYKEYVRRAIEESTPTVLPGNYQGGLGAQIAAAKVPLTEQGGGGGR